MITVCWINVYLTVDGFQVGKTYNFEHQAARHTDEHDHFVETTCLPVEVKRETMERINRA